MAGTVTNHDRLGRQNEQLRQENARLQAALEQAQAELREAGEVIRAIREGEVDALVVEGEGRAEIYSLQRFDSVYRSMVEECLPYGVWLAEADGRLLYVTPTFLELVQSDLQEMRAKGQFHFLPPGTREAVEREWARCRQTGEPFNVEYTVRPAEGTERVVWTHGMLAQTSDGLHRWVGLNADVTERVRIKEELRRQAEALREADRRKDEFLAMLGHELRNPLAAIQNGLHLLLKSAGGAASVESVKAMMAKQVRHLSRLVDDLLDVNRITRGTIRLRKEKVDLGQAVTHAVESVRPIVDGQRHALSVALPQEGICLEADPTRLEQVLINLLSNAARYTDPGGQIWVTARREGDEAIIRVRDNGVGIRADMLSKVFELFVQADPAREQARGGLGIGLTLVRKLVEMQGGSITAWSEGPGQGSEFTVRLPVLAGEIREPRTPRAAPPAGRTSGLRVLVVDDAEDQAQLLKMILESSGHEVRTAHDGPAALQACRTDMPDVVLLDIGLPGMSGHDVARQLRREQGDWRPLIISVSGYGQDEDRRRALEAGCDFHLIKPADLAELEALLALAGTRRSGRADLVDSRHRPPVGA